MLYTVEVSVYCYKVLSYVKLYTYLDSMYVASRIVRQRMETPAPRYENTTRTVWNSSSSSDGVTDWIERRKDDRMV